MDYLYNYQLNNPKVDTVKQIQIKKQAKPRKLPELDLRTPSGKPMKF